MTTDAHILDIDSTDMRNAVVTERGTRVVLYTIVSDGNTEHVSFYRGEAAAGAQPFAILDRYQLRSDRLTYQSHQKVKLDHCLKIKTKSKSAHFEEQDRKYTWKAGSEQSLVLTSDSNNAVVATFYPSKAARTTTTGPHAVLEPEARNIQDSVVLYGFLVLFKERYNTAVIFAQGNRSWRFEAVLSVVDLSL